MVRWQSVNFAAFVLACINLLHLDSAWAATTYRYNITLDNKRSLFDVRLCFDGKAPKSLSTGDKNTASYLRKINVLSPDSVARLVLEFGQIKTEHLPDDACIAYRVGFNGAIHDKRAYRVDGNVLVDIQTWLWRPRTIAADDVVELYFNLPKDMNMVGPWQPLGTRKNGYRVGATPIEWDGRVVFGEISQTHLSVLDSDLRLCFVGALTEQQKVDIKTWVATAADGVARVHGKFPVPQADVLVVAVGEAMGRDSAVPWAEVQRSGLPTVQFFINEKLPLQRFLDDWTPAHELSHLLHPSIDWHFKWVYEGLASYYQNVARARNGQLSEREAWQQLYDGFQRGLKESLEPDWWGRRKFKEMYWRGAAVALMADIELRQMSNNQQSLDTALREFQQCCFYPLKTWGGEEFFSKLDELTKTTIFSQRYGYYTRSKEYPDVTPLLNKLGVKVSEGRVALNNRSEWAALRERVMAVQNIAQLELHDLPNKFVHHAQLESESNLNLRHPY